MPNIDYTPTPPTVFFGSTANMACADIPIIDDSVVEPNETFSVDFSAPGDVLRGSPEQAMVTILDNDGKLARDQSIPLPLINIHRYNTTLH